MITGGPGNDGPSWSRPGRYPTYPLPVTRRESTSRPIPSPAEPASAIRFQIQSNVPTPSASAWKR